MPDPHPSAEPARRPRRLFGRDRAGRTDAVPRTADIQRVVDDLLPPGGRRERVLASAPVDTSDGPDWVAGTAAAVYLPARATGGPQTADSDVTEAVLTTTRRRVPWTAVERAHWDADAAAFTVTETDGGLTRLSMADPARFGQLVKERVEASVLVDRHVRIEGRRGVRIVGRRDPSSDAEPTWRVISDRGLDLSDPAVEAAVAAEVAAVRDEF